MRNIDNTPIHIYSSSCLIKHQIHERIKATLKWIIIFDLINLSALKCRRFLINIPKNKPNEQNVDPISIDIKRPSSRRKHVRRIVNTINKIVKSANDKISFMFFL